MENPVVFPEIPDRQKGLETYVPSYSREGLLKSLTLENVRELATYELPNISEVERPIIDENRFTLTPTAPPLTLISATTFVMLVILFSLAHFSFFQHEARRSDTFLAPGTLFGVLRRTKASRIASFILMFIQRSPCYC